MKFMWMFSFVFLQFPISSFSAQSLPIPFSYSVVGDSPDNSSRTYRGAGWRLWEVNSHGAVFFFSDFNFSGPNDEYLGKVFVTEILDESPAAAANVKVGSEIISVDGIMLSNINAETRERFVKYVFSSGTNAIRVLLREYDKSGRPGAEYETYITASDIDRLRWMQPTNLGSGGRSRGVSYNSSSKWAENITTGTFFSEANILVTGETDTYRFFSTPLFNQLKSCLTSPLDNRGMTIDQGSQLYIRLDFKEFPVPALIPYILSSSLDPKSSWDSFLRSVLPWASDSISSHFQLMYPADGNIESCEVNLLPAPPEPLRGPHPL